MSTFCKRMSLVVVCFLLCAAIAWASGGKETTATEVTKTEPSGTVIWINSDMPSLYNLDEYIRLSGVKISDFNESPLLKAKVDAGDLPPVGDRLPKNPLVVEPWEEIGRYGGTLDNFNNGDIG